MASREAALLDQLIATYRELNGRVRALPDDRLRLKGEGNASVRDVVVRLRDNELRFSQALKERLTGVVMPEVFTEGDAPVLGMEGENDSTPVVLSQFGTARESTLAMLRGMATEDWDATIEGGHPVSHRIQQLADNDRKQVERINGLLGAP